MDLAGGKMPSEIRFGLPNKMLMALGILQGYLSHPWLFLGASLLTFPSFRRKIPEKFPREFVEQTAFQAWMYIRLKKQVGQDTAYEIMRAMILPIGLALQHNNFHAAEQERTFRNLVQAQKEMNKNGMTRWNVMKIEKETDDTYEIKITHCMYHAFYKSLGIPEMTKMMCAVDNAVFNSYAPEGIVFHRKGIGNRIVDGSDACRMVLENKMGK
jgi:predicted ArsR family transcriptional regulator